MLNYWLQSAMAASKMTQADLARHLTTSLGRSVDRAAVNKMVAGDRKILADELLEISRICEFPLPLAGRTPASEYEQALAAILPSLDQLDVYPIDTAQFSDDADILHVSMSTLKQVLNKNLQASIADETLRSQCADGIMNDLKSRISDLQIFIVR